VFLSNHSFMKAAFPRVPFWILVVILHTAALICCGCAFDRLRFTIDKGVLTPSGTNVVSIVP